MDSRPGASAPAISMPGRSVAANPPVDTPPRPDRDRTPPNPREECDPLTMPARHGHVVPLATFILHGVIFAPIPLQFSLSY